MSGPRSSLPPVLSPVAPGETLAGKYLVERVLASGGMGVVVAAQHNQLDERVAIKFLIPEALQNRDTVERFAREAKAAVRIKSEHVARVLDVGEIPGGSPYIVMEFLEGEDLEEYVARRGRAPIEEAVGFVLQASEAIAEAHALGIVHRDLKPGNLFLTTRADGSTCTKVLDFGISKVDPRLSKNQAALTSATAVLGSPLYMAPEQMRSARDADSRSDLWSLGMILYELLTGTAAFDAPTVLEMCNRIQTEQPASIRKNRAEVPVELEQAVMRCLAKRPEDRYQTLGQLVDAIAPFGPPRGQISVERVHAVMTRAGTVSRPSSPRLDGPASERRSPSNDAPGMKPRSRSVEPSAVTVDADALASQALRMTPAAWAQTSGKRLPRGPIIWIGAGGLVALLALGGWALRGASSEHLAPTAEPPRPTLATPSVASVAAPEVVPQQGAASPVGEPSEEPAAPSSSVSAEATAPHRRVRGPLPVSSARAVKPGGAASAFRPLPGTSSTSRNRRDMMAGSYGANARTRRHRSLEDETDEEVTPAGGTVIGGEIVSSRPLAERALPPGVDALDLGPRELANLMLTAVVRARADLVTLEPGPTDWALTVKRAGETLGVFAVTAEAGMAAAVRLAAAAGVDPLVVGTSPAGNEAGSRVRLRVGQRAGDVFVGVSASPNGLAVELRPLATEGEPPAPPQRVSLLRRCPGCGAVYGLQDASCPVDGRPLESISDEPVPGGSIGVYCLGVRLGSGGMGVVLAGEHAFLHRAVAIKLLHRSIEQEPVVCRRFLAEARAAARIRHPGVVEVLDYGLLHDGRPYLVMERIAGESLEDRLQRVGHLTPAAALALVREIAIALGAAHERGVVHLDLKPANVILLDGPTDAPRVKLIDFGAAARAGCVAEDGLVVGTPEYMSPEHARGEPADARSDLYSLGVMLYELLTGKLPFDFDDVMRIFRAHLLEQPPPMIAPEGALPDAVHALVARALSKKPAERHQTAEELVADLDVARRAVARGPWLRWLA